MESNQHLFSYGQRCGMNMQPCIAEHHHKRSPKTSERFRNESGYWETSFLSSGLFQALPATVGREGPLPGSKARESNDRKGNAV